MLITVSLLFCLQSVNALSSSFSINKEKAKSLLKVKSSRFRGPSHENYAGYSKEWSPGLEKECFEEDQFCDDYEELAETGENYYDEFMFRTCKKKFWGWKCRGKLKSTKSAYKKYYRVCKTAINQYRCILSFRYYLQCIEVERDYEKSPTRKQAIFCREKIDEIIEKINKSSSISRTLERDECGDDWECHWNAHLNSTNKL